MRTLPKCDHLAKIGLEHLEESGPQWQHICLQNGRQWYLYTRSDDDFIREPPTPHAPGGMPYGFPNPDEALTFKTRCINKLQRFLKKTRQAA